MGTGLVLLAGMNAVVAALLLRPWTSIDTTVARGEVWLMLAGAFNLAVTVLGASLLHFSTGRRSQWARVRAVGLMQHLEPGRPPVPTA